MRNLQEQSFCYQNLFLPFTVRINCSNDLKKFANSRPSAPNFKIFSQSLEQFSLTVGQNKFGDKIPVITSKISAYVIVYSKKKDLEHDILGH